MPKIDLIGEKYGRLTVLRELKKTTKERRFLCHCDCGNVVPVQMVSLRTGNTRSCGCLLGETSAGKLTIDLTGQTFHHLTVLGRVGSQKRPKQSAALWLCECVCGNLVTATGGNLRAGNKKSCGCMRKRRKGSEHE